MNVTNSINVTSIIAGTSGAAMNNGNQMNLPPINNQCIPNWNKREILTLIEIYNNVRNTSTRKNQLWTHIVEQLNGKDIHYTSLQVQNKFNRLNAMYMKVKRSKQRGEPEIPFIYFNEFDRIFGTNHVNSVPAIQSPSLMNAQEEVTNATVSADEEDCIESLDEISNSGQRKRNALSEILTDSFDKLIQQMEKQHKEKIKKLNEIDKNHKDLMKELIDKF